MCKLQSPSKYSPFDAVHLLRLFSHCSKQFLNSSILMPFGASAVFCFTSSTVAKHFPLRTLLMVRGELLRARLGGQRRWGTWVMLLMVKNCWALSAVWAGALINHPSVNGQTYWKSLQKNSLKCTQPLTTTPAGTLIQMGFQNTYLTGEAYTIRSLPSRR